MEQCQLGENFVLSNNQMMRMERMQAMGNQVLPVLTSRQVQFTTTAYMDIEGPTAAPYEVGIILARRSCILSAKVFYIIPVSPPDKVLWRNRVIHLTAYH